MEPTTLTETEYNRLLRTMLAEVCTEDDPIFGENIRRLELETECMQFGMNLPLVRVVPDVA